MSSRIAAKPRENGNVEVAFISEDRKGVSVSMPAQDIGTLVSGLLLAATESSSAAKISFPPGSSLQGVSILPPTNIGLTNIPDSDDHALIVHMGAARFALRLRPADVRGLEQVFRTLMADSARAN